MWITERVLHQGRATELSWLQKYPLQCFSRLRSCQNGTGCSGDGYDTARPPMLRPAQEKMQCKRFALENVGRMRLHILIID